MNAVRAHAELNQWLLTEHVREKHGDPEGATAQAWGAVMRIAMSTGIVQRDGFRLDKHGSPKTLWKSRVYRGS